jgi:hypothetical protein
MTNAPLTFFQRTMWSKKTRCGAAVRETHAFLQLSDK